MTRRLVTGSLVTGSLVTGSLGFVCTSAFLFAAAAPAVAASTQLTVSQLPCGTRSEIVDILTKTYGEQEFAHGLANTGALAEVFVGPKGTWTIVATSPNGTSCLIGAGRAWERSPPSKSAGTGGDEEGI